MTNTKILSEVEEIVFNQLGCEDLEDFKNILSDVCKCSSGAAGGFSGFIYYNETVAFFNNNKILIMEILKNDAQDFGYKTISEFVANFNCLDVTAFEVEQVLFFDANDMETTIKNAISWYILERVAFQNDN